jgi:hypothetical protein
MDGSFGVFDGLALIAEFGNDEDADVYRRDALQLAWPEAFRRSEYDDLFVAEIPEDYSDAWPRLVAALRRSRRQDRTVEKFLTVLRAAQKERYATARM